MASLMIQLSTRTPLWTGGVDGTMDRLHETGILGSLRWWGEVVLRAQGGSACDPSKHTCPDKEKNYCDACALFGATGLKRAFYIDWEPVLNPDPEERLEIQVQSNQGWYLKRALFSSDLHGDLRIIRPPSSISGEEAEQFLSLLLRIASDWGGIGARTQQGYGVIHVITEPKLNLSQALRAIEKLKDRPKRQVAVGLGLPRLDEFFFARIRFQLQDDLNFNFIRSRATKATPDGELSWYKNNKVLPLAPIVRYHLRQLIRQQILHNGKPNAPVRWRLMGVLNARYHPPDFGKVKPILWECSRCHDPWTSDPGRRTHKDCGGWIQEREWQCENCPQTWSSRNDLNSATREIERYKSLIHVSHAYSVPDDCYEFRIWGWIPRELPGNVQRNTMLAKLRQWLGVTVPDARGFQDAQGGTLWNSSYVNLKGPSVLWRESPNVEDLIEVGGDDL